MNSQGLADGVIYYDADGNIQEQKANAVVLACNGVGTPRLMLNSRSPQFPDGIANSSGLVGKNLMFHPYSILFGTFDERIDGNMGPLGANLISQEFYETDLSRGFVRGYAFQVNRGFGPLSTAHNGNGAGRLPWGSDHHTEFAEKFGHTLHIAVIGEDLPEEHNRVTLDPELTDSDGIPAPKVSYTLSDNSRKMLDHGIGNATQVFEAAGAHTVNAIPLLRGGGWHLMGTARMGDDPDNSVVSGAGQAHDVKNLFIVDGSVFVTAGAVNPTSTIQAVALHIADSFKTKARRLLD